MPAPQSSSLKTTAVSAGLTTEEARRRLEQFGPNAMPDTTLRPLARAIAQLWAPVPWMLELAIVMEIALGRYVEGAIVAVLLGANAALGFFQEGRAQATLAAMKSRLALNAVVRRDNVWMTLPAAGLVAGDVVKLSLGGIVAADVRLTEGSVLLDQSMLTGESVPAEAGAGFETYAGALVRRGEAVADVTATGARTKFGRTAELVRTAHVESTQQKAVLLVVGNLALVSGAMIVVLVVYSHMLGLKAPEIIPLALTALLGAIPIGLPATFTLAAALGARELAKRHVLLTRLSAVDEAASIDVLCADKTGTLTQNELTLTAVHAMPGFDDAHVLGLAALASSDGGQDSVDAAIRAAAVKQAVADLPGTGTPRTFVPFDPATKMSEATAADASGATVRVVKGAFEVVAALAPADSSALATANGLEAQGFRVLAVAAGPPAAMKLAGIIALSDPPRADAAALIARLRALGVRVVMVTGDAAATAGIVARAVGLEGKICPAGPIPGSTPGDARPEDFGVFAGTLPEGKFQLVKAFQKSGHTVGMCGDGVNDAPALRQAQMGIAVSTATDVARLAAGIVLTEPGLGGIVESVKEGRITFQRVLTYTLNSVTNKIVKVFFLAAGLFLTGQAILTPLLMVISMLGGDLLGMSVSTDNVEPSALPNSWRIRQLTIAGVFMGLAELIFCVGALACGRLRLGTGIEPLRTLSFVVLVFGNQTALYLNRDRRRLGSCRPSRWLVLSSAIDVLSAAALAIFGIAMAPLPITVVLCTLLAAGAFAFVLDFAKAPVFRKLGIA
jgi:H+-transporting ATPase